MPAGEHRDSSNVLYHRFDSFAGSACRRGSLTSVVSRQSGRQGCESVMTAMPYGADGWQVRVLQAAVFATFPHWAPFLRKAAIGSGFLGMPVRFTGKC